MRRRVSRGAMAMGALFAAVELVGQTRMCGGLRNYITPRLFWLQPLTPLGIKVSASTECLKSGRACRRLISCVLTG